MRYSLHFVLTWIIYILLFDIREPAFLLRGISLLSLLCCKQLCLRFVSVLHRVTDLWQFYSPAREHVSPVGFVPCWHPCRATPRERRMPRNVRNDRDRQRWTQARHALQLFWFPASQTMATDPKRLMHWGLQILKLSSLLQTDAGNIFFKKKKIMFLKPVRGFRPIYLFYQWCHFVHCQLLRLLICWVLAVHSGECAFISSSTQSEQLQTAHWNIYMIMNMHNSSKLSAFFFLLPTNHLKSETLTLICYHQCMREMHQTVVIAKLKEIYIIL